MLTLRNLAMFPLVLIFRAIPGLLWFPISYLAQALEDWQELMNRHGVYLKRKGE